MVVAKKSSTGFLWMHLGFWWILSKWANISQVTFPSSSHFRSLYWVLPPPPYLKLSRAVGIHCQEQCFPPRKLHFCLALFLTTVQHWEHCWGMPKLVFSQSSYWKRNGVLSKERKDILRWKMTRKESKSENRLEYIPKWKFDFQKYELIKIFGVFLYSRLYSFWCLVICLLFVGC